MRTKDGLFDFANIEECEITLDDVANSLSKVCRFTGHTNRFFSVAAHQLFASDLACDETDNPMLALALLVHDAHEAFVTDMSTPFKTYIRMMMPSFSLKNITDRIDDRFCICNGIGWLSGFNILHCEKVKHYDRLSLFIEAQEHFDTPTELDWGYEYGKQERARLQAYYNMSMEDIERTYKEAFAYYVNRINDSGKSLNTLAEEFLTEKEYKEAFEEIPKETSFEFLVDESYPIIPRRVSTVDSSTGYNHINQFPYGSPYTNPYFPYTSPNTFPQKQPYNTPPINPNKFPDNPSCLQKQTGSGNPKVRSGMIKPSMSYVPSGPLVPVAEAFRDGAENKGYGKMNWRTEEVCASIYYDAAWRHINAWFDGESHADDSGVLHLAHAIASLMILLDAESCGTLIDDRITSPKNHFGELVARSIEKRSKNS